MIGFQHLRQRVLRGCPVFRPVARYSKSSVNSWFSPNSTTSLKCFTCWTTVYNCGESKHVDGCFIDSVSICQSMHSKSRITQRMLDWRWQWSICLTGVFRSLLFLYKQYKLKQLTSSVTIKGMSVYNPLSRREKVFFFFFHYSNC